MLAFNELEQWNNCGCIRLLAGLPRLSGQLAVRAEPGAAGEVTGVVEGSRLALDIS